MTGKQPTKQAPRSPWLLRAVLGQVFSADFFASNWIAVVAVIVMCMVYISSKYICQTRIEQIDRLTRELEVVKAERVRARSDYMGATCESAMQELVDSMHLGLNVQERPPFKLSKQ